jgi:ferredoxin/flavodoxin---NADP+ reductase
MKWPGMSYSILESLWLCANIRRLRIGAPHVTRNCKPGQFVIVRPTTDGERIPLTIAQSDPKAQTIVLIVQVVGATTQALCALEAGQCIPDVAGPLGHPTDIRNVGHAVLVGGGVGTAVIYPQAAALKQAGNYVSAIIGGRSRPMVILEPELAEICDHVFACTDDGSYGFHGLVTDRLRALIESTTIPVGMVLCAGPVPMMRAVAEVTRPLKIPTIASLNPIMVDGTGMCGGCRVRCGGQVKFACVDGPEFDAHAVDFKELGDRLGAYREQEKLAMERLACRLVTK